MITYSIGEVADLLGMSRDMVRYYEKQGIIHAARNDKNNYRTYDTMTIFWLLEAVQHKNLGLNIGDIASMRMADYERQSVAFLTRSIARLQDERAYQQRLIARLELLRDRFALGIANIDNFWVARLPAHYATNLVTGYGDVYDRFSLAKETSALIFSNTVNPFMDSGFEKADDAQIWQLMISKADAEGIGAVEAIEKTGAFVLREATFALCTHINIGEINAFDPAVIDAFVAHCEATAYQSNPAVPVSALLVSRGTIDGQFHRILELRYPILL